MICAKCGKHTDNPKGSAKYLMCPKCFKKEFGSMDKYMKELKRMDKWKQDAGYVKNQFQKRINIIYAVIVGAWL